MFFSLSSCKVLLDSLPCTGDLHVSSYSFFVQCRTELEVSGTFPFCQPGPQPWVPSLGAANGVGSSSLFPVLGRCCLRPGRSGGSWHVCKLYVTSDLKTAQTFQVVQVYSHVCLKKKVDTCQLGSSGSRRPRQRLYGTKSAAGTERMWFFPSWVGWWVPLHLSGLDTGLGIGSETRHRMFLTNCSEQHSAPAHKSFTDGNWGKSTSDGFLSQLGI